MKKKQLLKKKNKLEQDRWRKMSLAEMVAELGKSHKKRRFHRKKRQLYSSVDLDGASLGSGRIIYTPMGNKR